jgi:hypothetical protein
VYDCRTRARRTLLAMARLDQLDAVGRTVALVVVHMLAEQRLWRLEPCGGEGHDSRCSEYAACIVLVYLAVRLGIAWSVHGGEAVRQLARAVHLFYEAGACRRAVVGLESGTDIFRRCDASGGRRVVDEGRHDG